MCAAAFLREYAVVDPSAPPTILILDTAPSSAADVRVPAILSWLTSRYRGGPFGTFMWRQLARRYSYPPAEPGADPDLIESAHRAFATVDSSTIFSQVKFVRQYAATSAHTWRRPADRTVFLRGVPAGGDPFIATDSAVTAWRELVPDLREAQLQERLDTWHVPIIERPRETMATIMSALPTPILVTRARHPGGRGPAARPARDRRGTRHPRSPGETGSDGSRCLPARARRSPPSRCPWCRP